MRISDWNSDVCSSDLRAGHGAVVALWRAECAAGAGRRPGGARPGRGGAAQCRSEARRVGKEGVSKCRSRWSAHNSKKKKQHHDTQSVIPRVSHNVNSAQQTSNIGQLLYMISTY